jgi:hypothetical protein
MKSRDYKYVVLRKPDPTNPTPESALLAVVPGTGYHFQAVGGLEEDGWRVMSAGYFRLHDAEGEEKDRAYVFGQSVGYGIGPVEGDQKLIEDYLRAYRINTCGGEYDVRVAWSGTLRLVSRLVLNVNGAVIDNH